MAKFDIIPKAYVSFFEDMVQVLNQDYNNHYNSYTKELLLQKVKSLIIILNSDVLPNYHNQNIVGVPEATQIISLLNEILSMCGSIVTRLNVELKSSNDETSFQLEISKNINPTVTSKIGKLVQYCTQ
jgi:hypothetical protein